MPWFWAFVPICGSSKPCIRGNTSYRDKTKGSWAYTIVGVIFTALMGLAPSRRRYRLHVPQSVL